jgi:raffinose/stachyose/melibiose transport system permease protein
VTSKTERIGSYATLCFFAVLTLFPIVGILLVALTHSDTPVTGFSLPWPPTFANFGRAWSVGHFSAYLRSSVIIASSVVAISSVLSILAGYALGMMRFPGARLLFYVLLLGIIMPFEALIIPLYYDLRGFGITNSYWSVILPDVGVSVSFGTFWMRAFFLSSPRSLSEAARIDGASSWTTLWRVLVPTARPAILTMVVLLFMWTWNDFLLPLVMLQSPDLGTAPLGIAFFQGQYSSDTQGLAAAAVLVAAPVVVLYVFLQRHFIRGMIAGATKL